LKRIYALVAALVMVLLILIPSVSMAEEPSSGAAKGPVTIYFDLGGVKSVRSIKSFGSSYGAVWTMYFYGGDGVSLKSLTVSYATQNWVDIGSMSYNIRYVSLDIPQDEQSSGIQLASGSLGSGTATSYRSFYYNPPADLTDPPLPAPAAPTNLLATAGDKKVDLSWTSALGSVTGYNVYQDGVKVNGSPIAALTYTVTGLTNGTSYSYQVTAVDGTVESSKSAAVSVTPMAPPPVPPPAVPTGVTAADTGLKATVTWNANTESDLAGYNVYRDGTKANSSLVTGTTMDVTGLTRGQTYSFRVSAVNTSGKESDKSAEALVTIANVMDVQFIPNMDSIVLQLVGGSPPYSVDWGIGTDTFNATKYTITGLVPDTEYTVTVSDMAGQTATKTVNTGNMKAFNPPTMPDPVSMFQKMIDSFGSAGTIALAIIGGAVGLGILCIIGIWGWRLSKRWLSAAK